MQFFGTPCSPIIHYPTVRYSALVRYSDTLLSVTHLTLFTCSTVHPRLVANHHTTQACSHFCLFFGGGRGGRESFFLGKEQILGTAAYITMQKLTTQEEHPILYTPFNLSHELSSFSIKYSKTHKSRLKCEIV